MSKFILDQVCMLQTRLAATESMTHDVIRDLLGVKLDITNYAVSSDLFLYCEISWLRFLIALHFCCFWYVPEFDRPKPNREISGGSSSSERKVLCKGTLCLKIIVCCKFYKMFNLIPISLSLGKRESWP